MKNDMNVVYIIKKQKVRLNKRNIASECGHKSHQSTVWAFNMRKSLNYP